MIRKRVRETKTSRRKRKYLNPCYNSDDIYKFYYKNYSLRGNEYNINLKEFKSITHDYNKILRHLIVEESQIITIPFRLGEMLIKKKKMSYNEKHLKIDFNHLRLTGKKKFHTNIHSKGWTGRWFWSKRNCVVKNKKYYSFTPVDTMKKAMATIMKTPEGYKRYFEA